MQHLNLLLHKKILVTQIKSEAKLNDRQKGSLVGLGLRGIGSSYELTCSDCVLGMIKKVNHLIKISLN